MPASATPKGSAARASRKVKGKAKPVAATKTKKAVARRIPAQTSLLEDTGARLSVLQDRAGNAADTLRSTLANAADGLRAVNLQAIEYLHEDADRMFRAAKAAMKAKSLREVLEIQADFMRAQMTHQFRQVRDLGALSADHVRETIAPITVALRGKPSRTAA